jgi:hypothetical protein
LKNASFQVSSLRSWNLAFDCFHFFTLFQKLFSGHNAIRWVSLPLLYPFWFKCWFALLCYMCYCAFL